MKRTILLSILTAFASSVSFSQTEPAAIKLEASKDAVFGPRWPSEVFGNINKLTAITWTHSGAHHITRSVIGFPLESIPYGFVIDSAKLVLNYLGKPTNESFDTHSGDNSMYLERVTGQWDETVTWDTRPATVEDGRIEVPRYVVDTQNYVIDVSEMIKLAVAGIGDFTGFLIRQQNETDPYRGSLFASRDHEDTTRHPYLLIYGVENSSKCLIYETVKIEVFDTVRITVTDTIKYFDTTTVTVTVTDTLCKPAEIVPIENPLVGPVISLEASKDAVFGPRWPSETFGNINKLTAITWTHGGAQHITRSVIGFPLESIPSGFVIDSAKLVLNYLGKPTNESFDTHSGDNSMYIERITGQWDETVTWETRPATVEDGRIEVPRYVVDTQNYVIDVSEMIKLAVAGTGDFTGFLIRQQSETDPYRGSLFASREHEDSTRHPKLIIYGIESSQNLDNGKIKIYDTVKVYETVYDTVQVYETVYDTVTAESSLKIPVVTSNSDDSQVVELSIFPNPTKDLIVIDAEELGLLKGNFIKIFSQTGQELKHIEIDGKKIEISLLSLGDLGTYTLVVLNKDGEVLKSAKIILY
jgi:hypothetical protein